MLTFRYRTFEFETLRHRSRSWVPVRCGSGSAPPTTGKVLPRRARQAARPRLVHRHARMGRRPALPVRVCRRHPRLGCPRRRRRVLALLGRRPRRGPPRRPAQRPLRPGRRRRALPAARRGRRGALVLADSPAAFLAGMFVFGLGLTAAVPAKQVLVLRWVDQRRPPPDLRLQVHRRGPRHGGRRLRRRPPRRPARPPGTGRRVPHRRSRVRDLVARHRRSPGGAPASTRAATSSPTCSDAGEPARVAARSSSPPRRCAGPPWSP